jgi:phosphotransferase system  glucose/maltose/N-acetylglucosamine-specific IIC component
MFISFIPLFLAILVALSPYRGNGVDFIFQILLASFLFLLVFRSLGPIVLTMAYRSTDNTRQAFLRRNPVMTHFLIEVEE